MNEKLRLILASGSAIRAAIMRGAGLDFEIMQPGVDEDEIKEKAGAEGADLETTAMRLAEAKALAVDCPGALVVGSDQILEFEGRPYDKPKDMASARARLLEMQGAKHTLINAVAVAKDGEILWRNLDRPALYLRPLEGPEIDAYLAEAGPDILKSVGAYQIESLGSRLFDRIDGDHFAVLGLGLYPLLGFLRRAGAIGY